MAASEVSSSEGAVGVPWSRDPPDPKTMASLGPVLSSCMGMLLFFFFFFFLITCGRMATGQKT